MKLTDDEIFNAMKLGKDLAAFIEESNAIEGIIRRPTMEEQVETSVFLDLSTLTLASVFKLQAVYAPDSPLRSREGMDVQIGNKKLPAGGPRILHALKNILAHLNNKGPDVWYTHIAFEHLHPFMDGNGRTGRALWAWHMLKIGRDPFNLPFLHRFYYQTLQCTDDVTLESAVTEKKEVPPPDIVFEVDQLAGLASKIRRDPWIKEHCQEKAEEAYAAAVALVTALGYPW